MIIKTTESAAAMNTTDLHDEPFGYHFGCPARIEVALKRFMPSIQATFDSQRELWNRFCEIEARTRTAYRVAVEAGSEESRMATIAVEAAKARLEAVLALPRRRRNKAILAEAAAALKVAKTSARAARKRAAEFMRPQLTEIELQRRGEVITAVRNSGLWWCHSEVIIERYDVARVRAMKTNSELRPVRDTKAFGMLRVRWQNGIPLHVLLNGGDTLASLSIEKRRTGKVMATLRLCIESDYRNKDYINVPIVFSRDIPEGSMVRNIVLFRRRTGSTLRWHGAIIVRQPCQAAAAASGDRIVTLTRDWLKDDDLFGRRMQHVGWLQGILDKKAGAIIRAIDDLDDEGTRKCDEILQRRGITYGCARWLAPHSQKIRDFLMTTNRMSQEMHHLRARALRQRDYRYQALARELTLAYDKFVVEKTAMHFESKGHDRPTWGRFIEILGHACKKHGCTVDFFVPESHKDKSAQQDAAE